MIEIRNDYLTSKVDPVGAELQSLRPNRDGHELIWQRDPEIWAGSAAILFPVVGRLIDGKYVFEGQIYAMPIRGIVRTETWTIADTDDSHVTFDISDSETSRQC
jgi:galactose mutarotase-like enzyme